MLDICVHYLVMALAGLMPLVDTTPSAEDADKKAGN